MRSHLFLIVTAVVVCMKFGPNASAAPPSAWGWLQGPFDYGGLKKAGFSDEQLGLLFSGDLSQKPVGGNNLLYTFWKRTVACEEGAMNCTQILIRANPGSNASNCFVATLAATCEGQMSPPPSDDITEDSHDMSKHPPEDPKVVHLPDPIKAPPAPKQRVLNFAVDCVQDANFNSYIWIRNDSMSSVPPMGYSVICVNTSSDAPVTFWAKSGGGYSQYPSGWWMNIAYDTTHTFDSCTGRALLQGATVATAVGDCHQGKSDPNFRPHGAGEKSVKRPAKERAE